MQLSRRSPAKAEVPGSRKAPALREALLTFSRPTLKPGEPGAPSEIQLFSFYTLKHPVLINVPILIIRALRLQQPLIPNRDQFLPAQVLEVQVFLAEKLLPRVLGVGYHGR